MGLESNNHSYCTQCKPSTLLQPPLGDYAGVKHALREAEVYYNMDVNCLDPLGRSALLIAIENENLEIMELLLDHGIHTGDALLYAIRKEVVGAVELLLSHRRPSGEKQVHDDVYPCVCVFEQEGADVPRMLIRCWMGSNFLICVCDNE